MLTNESWIFLAFFIIINIAGLLVLYSFHIPKLKLFQMFISYMGGMSVLLFSYSIFLNIRSNEAIEKNRIAYNTLQNIQNSYIQPQQGLLNQFPEGYFLYASMNQDTDLSQLLPQKFDKAKRKHVEVVYSLKIFQAMEDFLSTGAYDITGSYVWINNFIMWMQSPILQHYWHILNFNYSTDTREMVNRIIEKSNTLIELRKEKGQLTHQDYDAISRKFSVNFR